MLIAIVKYSRKRKLKEWRYLRHSTRQRTCFQVVYIVILRLKSWIWFLFFPIHSRADFCPRLIYHSNVTKEFLSNEKKQVRDDKNVFLMAYIRTRSETLLVVWFGCFCGPTNMSLQPNPWQLCKWKHLDFKPCDIQCDTDSLYHRHSWTKCVYPLTTNLVNLVLN